MKRVAVKERHILSFSIVFTVVAMAIGFGWIAYSASKVMKLEARGGELQSKNEGLKREIKANEELLGQWEVSLNKINRGEVDARQEAKKALNARSSVQDPGKSGTGQTIILNPALHDSAESPSKTKQLEQRVVDISLAIGKLTLAPKFRFEFLHTNGGRDQTVVYEYWKPVFEVKSCDMMSITQMGNKTVSNPGETGTPEDVSRTWNIDLQEIDAPKVYTTRMDIKDDVWWVHIYSRNGKFKTVVLGAKTKVEASALVTLFSYAANRCQSQ